MKCIIINIIIIISCKRVKNKKYGELENFRVMSRVRFVKIIISP